MNTIEKQGEEIEIISAKLEKERNKRTKEMCELEEYKESLEEQRRETESLRRMRLHLEGNMKKSDKRLKKRQPSILSLNRGGEIMALDNPEDQDLGGESSSSSSDETEDEDAHDKEDELRRKMEGERKSKDGKKKKVMSKNEARREIKDYIWPRMSDFTTEEGFKNMFKKQIMRAKRNGIPKTTIANSVCQSLLKNKRTADMFDELSEKFDTESLSGVLKIIDNLDSEQNSRNATERFYEINMDDSETARSYLGRLKRAHRSLFPKENERETNMIRKQFLEGFRHNGMELSEEDKNYLYNTPELNDLCARAMYVVKRNHEKERREKGGKERKDRQYRELNTVEYEEEVSRPSRAEPSQSFAGQKRQAMPPQRETRPTSEFYDNRGGAYYGQRQTGPNDGQRGRPTYGRPRQTYGNRGRSAGPDAPRVSVEEYKRGEAQNGDRVCYRCCTRNHIAFDCPYVSFCIYCKKETDHPSIRHDDVMAKKGNGAVHSL